MATDGLREAVLGGGCFSWLEAVYEQLRGVTTVSDRAKTARGAGP